MKKTLFHVLRLFLIILFVPSPSATAQQQKPNVLFIAIDDINDWIKPLGGNPQALTPQMDKFTQNGAMVFKNAVCAAPICCPSRSAVLSGFLPSKTGIYGNASNMRYSDIVKTHATLPEYFSKNGYHTLANGKIFHKHATEHGVDFGHWAFDEFARSRRYVKDSVDPKHVTSSKSGTINGVKDPAFIGKDSKLSWGPTKKPFEETVDYLVADWARQQLKRDFDKPFFMGVGFIKPHLPWFVPQEFFDKFPLDSIQAPQVKEDDLNDILNPDGTKLHSPSGEYLWVKKHGLEKAATRAYLANISYADACLGMVLDALQESGYADNTIVVIWGDHGWHLGEKLRYLKNTLWSEAAKTPLMVHTPDMKGIKYSTRTVSLIDMYPTLISLCHLPPKELDGHDFSPILKNPDAEWNYPGITVSVNGTSVMGERWHYIHNLSGAEELYDLSTDPMEWDNLIRDERYTSIAEDLKKWVPKSRTPAKNIHYSKPPNYVDAEADPTIKATRNLDNLK